MACNACTDVALFEKIHSYCSVGEINGSRIGIFAPKKRFLLGGGRGAGAKYCNEEILWGSLP